MTIIDISEVMLRQVDSGSEDFNVKPPMAMINHQKRRLTMQDISEVSLCLRQLQQDGVDLSESFQDEIGLSEKLRHPQNHLLGTLGNATIRRLSDNSNTRRSRRRSSMHQQQRQRRQPRGSLKVTSSTGGLGGMPALRRMNTHDSCPQQSSSFSRQQSLSSLGCCIMEDNSCSSGMPLIQPGNGRRRLSSFLVREERANTYSKMGHRRSSATSATTRGSINEEEDEGDRGGGRLHSNHCRRRGSSCSTSLHGGGSSTFSLRGSINSEMDATSNSFRSTKRNAVVPDYALIQSSHERAKNDKIKQAITSTRLQFDRVGLCGRQEELQTLKTSLREMVSSLQQRNGDDAYHSASDSDLSIDITDHLLTMGGGMDDSSQTHTSQFPNLRELVLIGGHSGCGKSALASAIQHSTEVVHEGLYCVGKYELHKQDVPMLGLISAAHRICEKILPLQHGHPKKFRRIRTEMKVLIGDVGLRLLSLAIGPILSEVLQQNYNVHADFDSSAHQAAELMGHSSTSQHDMSSRQFQKHLSLGSDTQKKLEIAFCIFFRIVCDHMAPVVMVLDDLQWCSDLSLVNILLDDDENSGLIIVGCYRSNEIGPEAALSEAVHKVTTRPPEGLMVTKMEIGNLPLESIRHWLSELLSKDEEEVEELAALCLSKTQGNMFFMKSFLTLLVEDGMLKFDIGSFTWGWNIQAIKEDTNVAPNLVEIIRNQMSRLHDCAIELMTLASCLGTSFVSHALWLVWKKFRTGKGARCDAILFDTILEVVTKANCLEKATASNCKDSTETYRFSHDKIQEASMSSIPLEEYKSMQYWVGTILVEELSTAELESMIYLVTDLLNVKCEESIQQAEMNLKAALTAKSVGCFSSTAKYVQQGIQCLPKETMWDSHLALAVKLHSLGAVAELNLTNTEMAERYCTAVINESKATPLQKCTVYHVRVLLCHLATKTEEALELCLDYLAELGCNFPRSKLVRKIQARPYLKQTMKKYIPTLEEMEQLPPMTDLTKIGAQRLLEEAGWMAYETKDTYLYILIRCRHVRWIRKYGLTNEAAAAYASFANVLMHVHGHFDTGKALADLSLATQSVTEDKHAEASTLGCVHQYVLGWVKPLQSQLHSLLAGYRSGIKSGNTLSGSNCLAAYLFGSFQSGTKLSLLQEDCNNYITQLEKLKMFIPLAVAKPISQLVENLIGNSDNTTVLTGSTMNEEEFEKSHKTPFLNIFLVRKCLACLYFGDFEAGAKIALRLGPDAVRKSYPGFGFGFEYLPFGLCLFAVARKTKQNKHKIAAEKIRNDLEKLVRKGCVNLVHHLSLLDAENHALNKRTRKAKDAYCRAATEAARGGFVQDAGLVNERYAHYLLELGDVSDAAYHMNEAMKYYGDWGATKKVELLKKEYSDLMKTSSVPRPRRASFPHYMLKGSSRRVLAPTPASEASIATPMWQNGGPLLA